MENERWQRIKTLLYEAIELPPEKRSQFLDHACDGDTAMHAELEALLDAHVEGAGFMNSPPSLLNDLPGIFSSEYNEGSEKIVGPYRLLNLLGQGGMGEVFLAERADGLFEQQVALKLVKYQDTAAVLRRFEAERRILASLQHRNIARLLDGGTSDEGRPYFVMEYVDGQPLTTYADTHNLSLEARLKLIVAVGKAVQHAHRNLVVHRDLKPSNILVWEDAEGEAQVKLLDFGIAKLLQEDSELNVLTESGARVMTRAYAAPEQVRGESITTATDVYALGAVLYELLTGRRLFEATTPYKLEAAILEEAPTLPSVVASDSTRAKSDNKGSFNFDFTVWAKELRGDLDVVCLKAVGKEPGARYDSVEAFVADLKRYLEGLPIEAQPPTRGYRFRKFIQRHRAGTVGAILLVTLITAFGIAMMRQQEETTRQRDRAELELAKSETVTDFLLDLFSANRPSEARGDTITARELLVRGQDRLESLEEQPELRALMKEHIGRIYRNLGEYDKALPLMQEALAERRRVLGDNHEDVAFSLGRLATLRTDQGQFEEALQLSLEALSIRQSLFVEDHPIIASNLSQLALLNKHMGRYEEAEQRFRELIVLVQRLYSPDDMRIATVHNNYGRLLDDMLAYDASYDQYQKALAINSQHLEPDHPDILITKNNLGMALYRVKRYEEAVEQLTEVVSLRRKILGNTHPGLATSLTTLGAVLMAKNDNALAIEHFKEAEDIYRNAFGKEHPSVATVKYNSARASHNLADWNVAESSYREALQIRTKALGADHPRVAFIEMYLGRLLHDMENYGEAEVLYLKVFSVFDQQFAKDNKSVVLIQEWLVDLYEVQGRMAAAERFKKEEKVDQGNVE